MHHKNSEYFIRGVDALDVSKEAWAPSAHAGRLNS